MVVELLTAEKPNIVTLRALAERYNKTDLLLWLQEGFLNRRDLLRQERELVAGELKNKQVAMLPIAAALGGMLLPAGIYILSLGQNQGAAGWGIPMATDIAFVVGFLSLFGKRVPKGLKIFILSLAIADDLGAIIVIAAVYCSNAQTYH